MRNRGFEIVSDFKDKHINLPTRKTSKSAGYDIEAAEDKIIKAGQMAVIATGLKAYMQDDEYLGIHIRSSLAFKKHLNLVITKEGMYPEFTIDGIEYEAEREFSRYGAVIHCHMKYFDEIVPLEMPKKKYKQMSMFHKLLPLAIVAIVLVLLVIIRFEDVGNWADKSVIIIGALVEIFVFHRYYYNMEE